MKAAYLGEQAGEVQAQAGEAMARQPGRRGRTMTDTATTPTAGAHTGGRLLDIAGLASGYSGVPVVRGLDLHVDAGEVVAMLGPNGAGKTTTLLTVSGILKVLEGIGRRLGRTHRVRFTPQGRPTRPGPCPRGSVAVLRPHRAGEPPPRSAGQQVHPGRRLRAGPRDAAGAATAHGSPCRAAVGWRAADAGHGPGAGVPTQAAAGRRDEPRSGADHRRTAAAARA